MATPNRSGAKKDLQAFIVGGIFILGLVFATYNYFNRNSAVTEPGAETAKEEKSALEKIKDLLSSSTEREEESEQPLGTGGPVEPYDYNIWEATDYKAGDIAKGNYMVVSGDTLWEIAEAVYGNGTEWTQILEANSSEIGFLPDGSQALIMPGQVLTIN